MIIKIKNQEYKSAKMIRKRYKEYMEAFDKIKDKEIYSDKDLEVMLEAIVKIYDNQFTIEEADEELTVTDIIYNFMIIQAEEGIDLQNRMDKAQKAFTKSK